MVKLITTFSPKGGAGTSVVTANLAIYLAQKGKKVLLMDAAPNGGTLHAYLNLPSYAVSDEVSEHFSILPLIGSDYQNLSFFSNLTSVAGTSKVHEHLVRWETEIKQSQFDFIFIDMGSNLGKDLFDVVGIADFSIMFNCPDPVSIEKSNYFIKELFNHRLKNVEQKCDLSFSVQNIKRSRKPLLFTPRNLLLLLSEASPRHTGQIASIVNDVNIGMVFNEIKSSSERDIAHIYQHIIRNSYGFETSLIGELSYSDVITSSINNMRPVVTFEKNGDFVEALDTISSNLSQQLFQKKGGGQ
jgi:flagellar biosynthesis protein FlhG